MAELVLALDLESRDQALRLLDRLSDVGWVKVGSILMTAAGPPLLSELRARGHSLFLDLKWHDIPNTVAGTVRVAAELGVAMVTVHTLGGREMLSAAAVAAGNRLRVVGVTVLTSHSPESLGHAVGRECVDLSAEVRRLAEEGLSAGIHGLVCSPFEVSELRQALGPGPLLIVPGIRRPGESAGDQARTGGAAEAVRAGATHLVVGRPILTAKDPAAAWMGYLAQVG